MSEPKTVFELLEKLKAEGVAPEHYGKHYEQFMEFRCREHGVPKHGHFELTPLCNLDCKMCYVHLDRCEKLLTVEQWKAIMQEAHRAGMLYASLTGGECLTYPGFDELYLYLRSIGVQVNVLSNGILVDAQQIAFFRQHPPRMIQVTLYGSNEDAYEAVTGRRMFRRVYENLLAMRDAELPLRIAVTPNRYMVEDMRLLLTLIEQTGIPYFINSGLFPPREETGRVTEDFTDEQYVEIYRIQREFKGWDLTTMDPVELPEEGRGCGEKCGVLCGAGRSGFAVKYDGTMSACTNLTDTTVRPLETGFDAAWKVIHEAANRYPRPAECDDCVYAPVCQTCAAVHQNAAEFGHCDRRICAKTKLLVQEGIFPLPEKQA